MSGSVLIVVRILRTWARLSRHADPTVAAAKRDILLKLAGIAAKQRTLDRACEWIRSALEHPQTIVREPNEVHRRAALDIGDGIDRAIDLARRVSSRRSRLQSHELCFSPGDPVLRLVVILRRWSSIVRLTERHQCGLPADELLRLAGIAATSTTLEEAAQTLTTYLRQRSKVRGPAMGGSDGGPIRATAIALLKELPRAVGVATD